MKASSFAAFAAARTSASVALRVISSFLVVGSR